MQYAQSKWTGLLIALQPSQTYSLKPTHSQQEILGNRKKSMSCAFEEVPSEKESKSRKPGCIYRIKSSENTVWYIGTLNIKLNVWYYQEE